MPVQLGSTTIVSALGVKRLNQIISYMFVDEMRHVYKIIMGFHATCIFLYIKDMY